MRVSTVLLAISATLGLTEGVPITAIPSGDTPAAAVRSHRASFELFKERFSRTYASAEEESLRFRHFAASAERARRRNAEHAAGGGAADVFGITQFSDLSPEEFRARYLGRGGVRPAAGDASAKVLAEAGGVRSHYEYPANATDIDWRRQGCVTKVKNQGQCGSCWAFSTVECVESAWALSGEKLEEFSVQELVSCDKLDSGCQGGDPTLAYDQLIKLGGLVPRAEYPYTSGGGDDGVCRFHVKDVIAKISGYFYATGPCTDSGKTCDDQDVEKLIRSVARKGPPSICVNAEPWQDYVSGVLRPHACSHGADDLDHCVQLVGFDRTSADRREWYATVRNSWADTWGIEGYIHLALTEGDKFANTCGYANEATFAVIDDDKH